MADILQQERRGPVAWLWLNRPDRLNALNPAALNALGTAFQALPADDTVRAVVLTARGRAFSTGLDLGWLSTLDADELVGRLKRVAAVLDLIESCPQPVVAAVQGAAVGAGLLVAMAADLCLASDQATFTTPEAKLSIFPALGMVWRLERRVGPTAARRLLLLGDPMDAAEAVRAGLIDRVVPAAALPAEAEALAARLAELPALALQRIKASFAAIHRPGYGEWEADQVRACWDAPDREAVLREFLEG